MSQTIPFGLHHGALVNVSAVSSGLDCDCVCPACYQPLVAKKGLRNVHHFAHHRGRECPYALETALHLKAKQILEKAKQIVLPPVFLHRQQKPLFSAQLVRFRKVYLENYLDKLLPDIIMESGKSKLLVEIRVSHGITPAKLKQLRSLGIAAIEIDALAIYREISARGRSLDESSFCNRLIHDLRHKQWLFNPRKNAAEYRLRGQAERKKVRRRQRGKYHFYVVNDCPLNKHQWRTGPLEGKAYADVWQDCLHCPYCLEVEYQKEFVGFREIPTEPTHLYCWGRKEPPEMPAYRCVV